MPLLFRVFPYLRRAAHDEPGGALYIPAQGGGRIDNPGDYSVLYMSDASAGAVAEAFGRFPEWTPEMLHGSPALPGSVRALARFHFPNDSPVCNLDDVKQLLALRLRPSEVVTRDYARSRIWAKRIHNWGAWAGVRWWSYYNSKWASIGLWDRSGLELQDVTMITLNDPAVEEASRTIVRRVRR